MKRALLTLGLAIVCPALLFAATPLRDINRTSTADSFVPLAPVDLPAVTLFPFDDGTHGPELWATDGTAGGTRLVLDINPGPAGSSIRYLTVANGVAFFWADDGTNGPELWRSDGTTAGTGIVANITPDDRVVDGPVEPPIVAMGGKVYFVANDGQSGVELWRSDGTAAGTYRLKDIAPGAASSEPDHLTAFGATLFFDANDGSGRGVWSTDGTPDGTRLTKPIASGPDGLGERLISGNTFYFTAGSASTGRELWRISASSTSPELVQDIVPGAAQSTPQGLIKANNGILFAENGALYYAGPSGGATLIAILPCPLGYPYTPSVVAMPTRTLFVTDDTLCDPAHSPTYSNYLVTDGTSAGTKPFEFDDQRHLRSLSGATKFVVDPSGAAYFFAERTHPNSISSDTSPMLWKTDGTPAGTHALTDPGGPRYLDSQYLAQLGGRAYFVYGAFTPNDTGGFELWSTDGTQQGTALAADVRPGQEGSSISQLVNARGKLMFIADDGVVGFQPWITDGTSSGTVRLHDTRVVTTTVGSSPSGYFPFAGGALFTADDGVAGNQLWFTDGTPAGTRRVVDTVIDAGSPQNFISLGSVALFPSGHGLWRTDGTAAGTFNIHGGNDPIVSIFGGLALNGVAYFAASDSSGVQLWRSDGTSAGTYLFKVLAPGSSSGAHPMAVIGGRLLFAGRVGTDPLMRLWITDGTDAGTVPLRMDMELGNSFDSVVFKGFLYFQGVDASGDRELWRSDGTVAGTIRVQDLRADGSSSPNQFFANDSTLMFNACLASICNLFASHDPAAGVEQLGTFQRSGSVATDGTSLFWLDAGTVGKNRLAVSDGTLAGTHYLQGALPFNGQIRQYAWFSGELVMAVDDMTRGTSLWATDGTVAGTHLLADIDTRTALDGEYSGFVPIGSKLLMTAYHPSLGLEPWVLDTAPNADDDSVRAKFNATSRLGVLDNDGDLAGQMDRSSIQIVTPPTFGTASVDAGTGEIVYMPITGRSGADTLQYVVKNQAGRTSNVATVSVLVSEPSGPAAGTAPVTPPPSQPTTPTAPTTPSGGGGGGGGAIDLMTLLTLLAFALVMSAADGGRRRRAREGQRSSQ